jgi:PEGA domain
MQKYLVTFLSLFILLIINSSAADKPQPRVFITDSESWEMVGHTAGAWNANGGGFAGETHGGARPQTAEIIKTFGERCPETVVNNKLEKVDYVVVLDHEGGKGLIRHRNKVAVFNRISGDAIMSHSTRSLGNSVKDACEVIVKDWGEHGEQIRAEEAAAKSAQPVTMPVSVVTEAAKPASAKLSIVSTPDGADISVDGSFVGNTPSTVELPAGEHSVSVTKSGYKTWERKIKLTSGEIRLNAELEKN